MAWLGWIVFGILACWMGFFSLIHQQQLDVLRHGVTQAVREVVAQQKKELSDLESSQIRLETELSREKAKTVEARIEHARVRDEVDSLDNKVAEARRGLEAVSAEIASQDPKQEKGILTRDAKRLESDIRRLRAGLSSLRTGLAAGGGVP